MASIQELVQSFKEADKKAKKYELVSKRTWHGQAERQAVIDKWNERLSKEFERMRVMAILALEKEIAKLKDELATAMANKASETRIADIKGQIERLEKALKELDKE